MKSFKTVDEYILNAKYGKEILIILREILKETELSETLKWGAPVYTINDKNVVGIGAFKSYAGIWFFQGALLTDKAGVLVNAQEGTTKALRQWRFSSAGEIDDKLVLEYVNEAIENQKKGKEIKADRKKPMVIPPELQDAFQENKELESAFNQLTPGCKREYADYVAEAKKEETRKRRVQ
ncbi:MAG: YdeI/OmpD-associated family protein, partial [Prolixibacteraceae bacterium]|nr:YdeI/OmpD-associated family protein [Prolixibacteraceae bacterium]